MFLRNRETLKKITLILLVIILAVCAGRFYHKYFRASLFDTSAYSDFASYYFPSQALKQGLNFYDINQVIPLAKTAVPYDKDIGPYLYPPLFIITLLPLTFISYAKAKFIWAIINLFFAVLLWRELYLRLKNNLFLLLAASAAILLFYPFARVFLYGQLEIIIFFFLLLGFRLYQEKKSWRAGLLLGLAAALKLYPAFFLLYFLLKKQWKLCLVAVSSMLLILSLSFIIIPRQNFQYYADTVLVKLIKGEASQQTVAGKISYAGTKYWPGNHSLNGLLAHTLTKQDVTQGLINNPALAKYLWYILSVVLLTTACCLTLKNKNEPLNYAMWLLAFLLINPLTWEHYLILTLPAFVFFALNKHHRYWRPMILLIFFAILAANIYYWYPYMRVGWGTILMSIKALALLGLFITLPLLEKNK